MPDNHDVGYCKPPKKSQFKPGHSGNPKGRPKGTKNLATDLAEELSEKILVTEGGKQKPISKQRAMVKALLAKALKGDARAATALLRLVPGAEEVQKAAVAAETLSPDDQEILQAFREQLVEELKGASKGDRS